MRISLRVLNCGKCPFMVKHLFRPDYCKKQPAVTLDFEWVPMECKLRNKYIDNGKVEVP
jgi:hypothetical protein